MSISEVNLPTSEELDGIERLYAVRWTLGGQDYASTLELKLPALLAAARRGIEALQGQAERKEFEEAFPLRGDIVNTGFNSYSDNDSGDDSVEARIYQARWEAWQAALKSAPVTKLTNSVTLNGWQLRKALEFVNPDGERDTEELDCDVRIKYYSVEVIDQETGDRSTFKARRSEERPKESGVSI